MSQQVKAQSAQMKVCGFQLTWAASGACITLMNFRPGRVRSTPGCCTLNVPARPVLANPVVERIARPSVDAYGRRATAIHFGDSRVQALAGALCVTLCAVTGITNRSLRALMTGLIGAPYSMTQASYDLARLHRNGLIARRPHANTYDLTPDGLAFSVFYTKVSSASVIGCMRRHRGDPVVIFTR